jgi:hypothetical protein
LSAIITGTKIKNIKHNIFPLDNIAASSKNV